MGIGKRPSLTGHLLLPLCSRVSSPKGCSLLPFANLLSASAHPPVQQEALGPLSEEEPQPVTAELALGAGAGPCPWLPAPEGFTYCAEEGREGKTKQRGGTTELRQRSSRNSSLPYFPAVVESARAQALGARGLSGRGRCTAGAPHLP